MKRLLLLAAILLGSCSPRVLTACADPNNMPFSNQAGQGFENKLAELFADKLKKKLDYVFFPQATGFVRMTLGAHRCDVALRGRARGLATFPDRPRSGLYPATTKAASSSRSHSARPMATSG